MHARAGATVPCVVLYAVSSQRYLSAYAEVFDRHKNRNLDPVLEQDFKADVLRIIASRQFKRIAFLVDDQVFIAPVHLKEILALDPNHATYSLRLGKRITRCQPLDIHTAIPPLLPLPGLPDHWLAWHWASGKGDWGGAGCIDGNVMSRAMVLRALEDPLASGVRGPQTLEMWLNESGMTPSVGICNVEPQVLNLAVNRVSAEPHLYPHGSVDADALLGRWEQGYQLCLRLIETMRSDSCHIICDIPLERR